MYIEEIEDKSPQQKWGSSMMKHLFYMMYLYMANKRPTLEFFQHKEKFIYCYNQWVRDDNEMLKSREVLPLKQPMVLEESQAGN